MAQIQACLLGSLALALGCSDLSVDEIDRTLTGSAGAGGQPAALAGAGAGAPGGNGASAGAAGSSTASGGTGDGGCQGDPGACADQCPADLNKTAPGDCGCGVPDTDMPTLASCQGLRRSLVHRYSFDDGARDTAGNAHGEIVTGTIDGGAAVLRGGASGDHVNLPNGIVHTLAAGTFEAWVTWSSGSDVWPRIFDFGSTTIKGQSVVGKTYLYLSAKTFQAAMTKNGFAEEIAVQSPATFPVDVVTHVAVVVGSELELYLNGALQAAKPLPLQLSVIDDVNVWLGRSQYQSDTSFTGKIHEFRVYDSALSAEQVAASFILGQDATTIGR